MDIRHQEWIEPNCSGFNQNLNCPMQAVHEIWYRECMQASINQDAERKKYFELKMNHSIAKYKAIICWW